MPAAQKAEHPASKPGQSAPGHLWSLIMAGGAGTRFWPESRSHRPKQFLSLVGKKTLIEQTLDRVHPAIPPRRVLVITNRRHASLVKKLLKISSSQIVGEPMGRNTAPCAVLAAAYFFRKDSNAVMAILPSDHKILKEVLFKKALNAAAKLAAQTKMPVTFGIKPSFANTGYGYLEMAAHFKKMGGFSAYRLKCFHEKPDAAKAQNFFESGKFLWNSGMFVWRADALLEAAREHLPEAYHLAFKILDAGMEKGLKKYYSQMPNISIDFGLMEKLAGKILTVPIDIGWHDLGGWLAFEEFWEKDAHGNAVRGKAVFVDSKNNLVKSDKLVAMIGVEDFVIVDTEDALLVCPKSKSEGIRQLVQALKERKMEVHL